MLKTKIICTLGPSSFNKPILKLLTREKVDIFRINLSHTNIDQIKERIEYLKRNKIKNICIDTEGAQMRTTHTKKKYFIKKNNLIEVHSKSHLSDKKKYIYTRILI